MKIGYLGSPGSFSYKAAQTYFSKSDDLIGLPSFPDLFQHIKKGDVEASLVPIENSIAGIIYGNYDLLEENHVQIVGEQYIKVEHYLLGYKENDLSTLQKVYSHPKALEQCERFLAKYPHIKIYPVGDTTAAAKKVAQEGAQGKSAAIASKECAALYGLDIIASRIEDDVHNYTRFLVVGNGLKGDSLARKYSISVILPHTSGSLALFLTKLGQAGCNLTQITSRPIPEKPFEYRFYIDFTAPDPVAVMSEIGNEGELKLLGTYTAKSISV